MEKDTKQVVATLVEVVDMLSDIAGAQGWAASAAVYTNADMDGMSETYEQANAARDKVVEVIKQLLDQ